MRPFYVNIYDYIDCKRAGKAVSPVFKNYGQFLKRTLAGRVFPLKTAKSNKSHRGLLERVFV